MNHSIHLHHKTLKKRSSQHKNNTELWNSIKRSFSIKDSYDNGSLSEITPVNIDKEDPTKEQNNLKCVYSATSTNREKCELCDSGLRITQDGLYLCINDHCGVLYTDVIDESAEWRFHNAEDAKSADPARCGMPINPLLAESSYGCKILYSSGSTYEMRKLRRYNEWQSMTYKEKSQYDEFQRITIIANNSGIPKIIIDEALRYHKKISEHRTFRGLNRDGIIAASIYVACRTLGCPRTAKEIATIFNLNNASSTKGCKNAISIINEIESDYHNNEKTNLGITKPESFIERYCSKLNMNQELTKVSLFVAMVIQHNNIIPENTPHAIAAGIVYFISQICKLNISKKDVNQISEISEVTINKCYKKLEIHKDKLIPQVVLNKWTNNNVIES